MLLGIAWRRTLGRCVLLFASDPCTVDGRELMMFSSEMKPDEEMPLIPMIRQTCQPQTPNLKPQTRNPKPETRNPKPETRNPKPETRNPKPETRPSRRKQAAPAPPS
ncbi:hypothetical protein T484DRAFT_3504282 [Baffinella frigidus]|nr:hypothetical protein T484DRAFT_3504282 [Cryptophyta sp. CCMP2293]